MSNIDTAKAFFDACETGKGWAGCARYCAPDATFSGQSVALADTHTLEGYTEWMKGLLVPLPDGRYELKGFAEDSDRDAVMAFAVFHGTQIRGSKPSARSRRLSKWALRQASMPTTQRGSFSNTASSSSRRNFRRSSTLPL